MSISPNEFGASFKGFLDQMSSAAPAEEPAIRKRLREHFGQETETLPTLTEKFPPYDHGNLQCAIESDWSKQNGSVEICGITPPHEHMGVTLAMLVAKSKSGLWGGME